MHIYASTLLAFATRIIYIFNSFRTYKLIFHKFSFQKKRTKLKHVLALCHGMFGFVCLSCVHP